LNQGYAEDILRWHAAHPEVEVHCFCEKPKVEPVWRYDDTLSFHKLDAAKFLKLMADCRGVACTAGFESLNEAAWLGKPLLVVPVANHVEQYLNALDAQKAGLAVASERLDLTPLLDNKPAGNLEAYRSWVRRSGPLFLSLIERVTRRPERTLAPAYSAAN
ncbi:MAG: glycosyltransferase family protein, partial [Limisphaerales bacterium]